MLETKGLPQSPDYRGPLAAAFSAAAKVAAGEDPVDSFGVRQDSACSTGSSAAAVSVPSLPRTLQALGRRGLIGIPAAAWARPVPGDEADKENVQAVEPISAASAAGPEDVGPASSAQQVTPADRATAESQLVPGEAAQQQERVATGSNAVSLQQPHAAEPNTPAAGADEEAGLTGMEASQAGQDASAEAVSAEVSAQTPLNPVGADQVHGSPAGENPEMETPLGQQAQRHAR